MSDLTDVQLGIVRDTRTEGGEYLCCAIPRFDTV